MLDTYRPSDASPLFALFEAAHTVRAAADLTVIHLSLTSTQARVLHILQNAPNGKPFSDISLRTGMSPAATTTMMARLSARDLIDTAPNDYDRRCTLATLSPRGRRAWSKAAPELDRFGRMLAGWAGTSPQELAVMLSTIAAHVPSEWHISQMRAAG